MIEIKLTDSLRITSDEHNFVLEKKSGKDGKEFWRGYMWFQELNDLIDTLFLRDSRLCEARNPSELIKGLKRLKEVYLSLKAQLAK